MTKKVFVADDYGKYQEGNKIILASGVDRISVMVKRLKDYSKLDNKKVGLHADFGGEHLLDFLFLLGRPRKVARILDEQIASFYKMFGKYPAHLDSHRYLHLFPLLLPVFIKACKKYKIPCLRMSRRGVVKIANCTSLIIHCLAKINFWFYQKELDKLLEVDYFLSLDWYRQIDFALPGGTIMVIYHPENDINLLKQLQQNGGEK